MADVAFSISFIIGPVWGTAAYTAGGIAVATVSAAVAVGLFAIVFALLVKAERRSLAL
jgi:ACR3 family arsenite efflux pump ArsB